MTLEANIAIRVTPFEKKFCIQQARSERLSISGWVRKCMGLKPLSPPKYGLKRMSKKYISFRLLPDEKEELRMLSDKYNFTLSDMVREFCSIPGGSHV